MDFYQSIASLYDQIFPANPVQLDFVKNNLPNLDSRILDVGCGTGNLTFLLSKTYKEVSGIDLDEKMLDLALQKRGKLNHPAFYKLNMLDLGTNFGGQLFDAIVCFGNTLVHLDSLMEINEFIKLASKNLNKDGLLLLQIINYDRILKQEVKSLPCIDTDQIRFQRNYTYLREDHKIAFETILLNKISGEELKNCICLYPLRKEELNTMLVNNGFEDISFQGNFFGEALTENSLPLIVTGRKRFLT